MCYRLDDDDGLGVTGLMQECMLLDIIQSPTGVSGSKKRACIY